MKKIKILSVVVVTLLAFILLAGCSNSDTSNNTNTSQGTIKTGLGEIISIEKSKDATADADGAAQVDNLMAAVSIDGDGKITNVFIDSAQTIVGFNKSGVISADKAAELKTKVELGDAYGMKKASGIGKEWFEQVAALEKWMVGKTINEVKAMKTKDSDGKVISDEPDLISSATIGVEDFIKVVEKAVNNAK